MVVKQHKECTQTDRRANNQVAPSSSTSGTPSRTTDFPILNNYLTFIHYFGYSINPSDDTTARHLSIRVRRGTTYFDSFRRRRRANQPPAPEPRAQVDDHRGQAAVAAAAAAAATNTTEKLANQQARTGLTGAQYEKHQTTGTRRLVDRNWSATYQRSAQQTLGCFASLVLSSLKSGIKLIAIILTTFLALNHVIVLLDYVYRDSKAFMELMLELRLVITKFSALIFVLSWHKNQAKVRRLIRLVKSTSEYILTSGTGGALDPSNQVTNHRNESPSPSTFCDLVDRSQRLFDGHEQLRNLISSHSHIVNSSNNNSNTSNNNNNNNSNSKFRNINRRVLIWWCMCVCVTVTHFSLSEMEVSSAHHLWQWLDDYSLHTLDNRTITSGQLYFMASFDNYIYTVHVYGTRLIGASIICIVCSLQRDNIDCLRHHALELVRHYQSSVGQVTHKTASGEAAACLCLCLCRHRHVGNCNHSSSGGGFCASKQVANDLMAAQRTNKLPNSQQGSNLLMGCHANCKTNYPSDRRSHFTASSWPFIESTKKTTTTRSIRSTKHDIDFLSQSEQQQQQQHTSERHQSAGLTSLGSSIGKRGLFDRSDFFILGEADWLEVEARARKRPPLGYLSSTLWLLRLEALLAICLCLKFVCARLAAPSKWQLQLANYCAACRERVALGADTPQNGRVNLAASRRQAEVARLKQRNARRCCCCFESNNCERVNYRHAIGANGYEQNMKSNHLDEVASCIMQNRRRANDNSALAALGGPTPMTTNLQNRDRLVGGRKKRLVGGGAASAEVTQPERHFAANLATSGANLRPPLAWPPPSPPQLNLNNQQQAPPPQDPLTAGSHQLPASSSSGRAKVSACNHHAEPKGNSFFLMSQSLEQQLEQLARKYELIRTVSVQIDSCFGRMLLFQYSFLFLMSCIDVVYFSLSFNPNTKTKYIIISGMILLWWPYLLLYKFASDIDVSSHELLTSVRRLARLALVSYHSASSEWLSALQAEGVGVSVGDGGGGGGGVCVGGLNEVGSALNESADLRTPDEDVNLPTTGPSCGYLQMATDARYLPVLAMTRFRRNLNLLHSGLFPLDLDLDLRKNGNGIGNGKHRQLTGGMHQLRVRIFTKLDKVFKPINLSIVGIMSVNRFFLLNFAKIVITASVMMIQFVSN